MSTDELNTDENRWNRLYQKNLSKIGESDEQKAIKELPVFGMFTKPYMDYKYGRISGADAVGEVVGDVAKEGATIVAGGAVLKGAGKLAKPVLKTGVAKVSELLSKSKSARMARFGENLSAAYSSKKVASASTSGASVSKNVTSLDWANARISHVKEHAGQNLIKPEHGVFYGDPIKVTDEAWVIAQKLKIKPLVINNRDHYVVPRANAGYYGGYSGTRENLNHILLITEHNSNKVITSFPSHKVGGNVKEFWKRAGLIGED